MFKNHPKGLIVAFFANMGERFGYYTMIAIFVYYMQAKFGLSTPDAGVFYGWFLFGIYFLPLLGGYIADNLLGYSRTITLGIVIMFVGYTMLAFPGLGMEFLIASLVVISLGTGFFKGNLQALVGSMYDRPEYSKNRDNAFNLFYMGINMGAFFAPFAADAMNRWLMKKRGFLYNSDLTDLASSYLRGDIQNTKGLPDLATQSSGHTVTDLHTFCVDYLDALTVSYNAAFAVAAASMILSLLVFTIFRKHYKHADVTEKQKQKVNPTTLQRLSPQEFRKRIFALILVFLVVIFFWLAFHQNGFTMSVFAKDYTISEVSRLTYIIFDLKSLLPLIACVFGIVMLTRAETLKKKLLWGGIALAGATVATLVVTLLYEDTMSTTPQLYQSFNPLFIVLLTPLVVGVFSWLRRKGKEPSSPRKIGIGMILTGIGFLILVIASLNLPFPMLTSMIPFEKNGPQWLISSYFVLTIAELFLSPIGISFVSKVAPPRLKGFMQGGWFAATAIGNLAAGLIGALWGVVYYSIFFAILVALCLVSAIFMFAVVKRLERAVSES